MTTDQILTLIGMLGIPGIISTALVTWLKQRDNARKKESVLTMRWMLCAGTAMKEMAVVIKTLGGNGELAAAVDRVDECGQDLETYLIEQNAQKNH